MTGSPGIGCLVAIRQSYYMCCILESGTPIFWGFFVVSDFIFKCCKMDAGNTFEDKKNYKKTILLIEVELSQTISYIK